MLKGIVTFILLLGGGLALPAQALESITLQLKWKHQFQFAGYYAALEKGFYREVGLDVRLVEADTTTDPAREVVEGHADFGVGTSALLLARQEGAPVVVLGVIFQHSPFVLLARGDGDIQTVHDLKGRRIMLEPHADELLAYLRRAGLGQDHIVTLPHSLGIEELIQGEVDAISAYSTNEPHALERLGIPPLQFTPRADGIDFYGDNLFTSERMVRLHPERVRAFLEASLKGWRYAMQHPDEIIELILTKYAEEPNRAQLQHEARQMLPLIQPVLVDMGTSSPHRWRHIADVTRNWVCCPGMSRSTASSTTPIPAFPSPRSKASSDSRAQRYCSDLPSCPSRCGATRPCASISRSARSRNASCAPCWTPRPCPS